MACAYEERLASPARRGCPVCGGAAGKRRFPYATRFNSVTFDYVQCRSCASVFVDPIPNPDTLIKMYAKGSYHDAHYVGVETAQYRASAKLLGNFLPQGARVLDYGCGVGLFLEALRAEGFAPIGVEFDREAAGYAADNSGCPVYSIAEFSSTPNRLGYDALHLGDVLEHLPEPAAVLRELLDVIKPGGLLFVEGPLENNPSPVFWTARLFGATKKLLRPKYIGCSPPTHLLRVSETQQADLLLRAEPRLSSLHWDVHETGWPYSRGGALKRAIAGVAQAIGGKRIGATTFGNRFRGIFLVPDRAHR